VDGDARTTSPALVAAGVVLAMVGAGGLAFGVVMALLPFRWDAPLIAGCGAALWVLGRFLLRK
jgi:hypothetical protein